MQIEEKFTSEPDLKKNAQYLGLFGNPRTHHQNSAENAELDSDVKSKDGEGDIEPINKESDEPQVNQAVFAQPPQPPPFS